jgi:asparagine synthase (glutamine-hydrolysing)
VSALDELGGFQLLELRSSLPDELLMYADKLSMAHGLEVRVPYLDKEVVEFCQQLPSRLKVRGLTGKYIHRQIARRFLDQKILDRKKRGFAVNVVDDWFKSGINTGLAGMLQDDDSMIYELLDPRSVRKLLNDHRSGARDNHKVLFSLTVVEQWLRLTKETPLPVEPSSPLRGERRNESRSALHKT